MTLHAALAPAGLYAGTITIGRVIERSDIHRAIVDAPGLLGGVTLGTLDPDELADTVWRLYRDRSEAESIVTARGG